MTDRPAMTESSRIWQTRLDASGRIVLPAEARVELGLDQGDDVLVVRDERGLHVTTPAQLASEVQEYFAALWPRGHSVVEELLRERRAEALGEARGD